MGDLMLGRRIHWPIYAAAEKLGLPIGIHAGSTYQRAPTPSGWPSYRVEDYVAQSSAFENQLVSFVTEGVFQKFPKLKLVLIESGFTWLPPLLWRTGKLWRGVRPEVPWLDRSPAEIIRDHVRLTLQPIDAPDGEMLRARSITSAPTGCCCSRPTIRTGSSTATTCCPTGCPTKRCAGSWSTTRSRPIRVCRRSGEIGDNASLEETVR